jgi:hypothetical protein
MNPESLLTGPKMQARLKASGIDARQVTRSRRTGYYVADFYSPGMQSPVTPARVWAERIQQRVGGLTIVDRDDTVADWRDGQPVIYASVTFAVRRPAG